MVWYSHVFQNFPQFVVIHTVKGFGIVNKPEIDVFLEFSSFFDDPTDAGNLMSCGSAGDYKADERAGVAGLSWRLSGRGAGRCNPAKLAIIKH